jgi:hypothetical protein
MDNRTCVAPISNTPSRHPLWPGLRFHAGGPSS